VTLGWLKHVHKDHIAGALMMLVGLAAVYFGRAHELGTVTNMGPSYFPTGIGILLAIVGLFIAMGGKSAKSSVVPDFPGEPEDVAKASQAAAHHSDHKTDWRGWSFIIAAFVAFIFLFKSAGAVPATTAIVFISAFSERKNTLLSAILLAVFANFVLVVVFWWALQMPLQLFGRQ
jgi:Tripartite tricarboxylate transporter TctB family